MEKYCKCRRLFSKWGPYMVQYLTGFGRAMIINTLYFSRFRFYAQALVLPRKLSAAIVEDAQYLLNEKEIVMNVDEIGSELTNNRVLRDGVQTQNKSKLGVGLLPWEAHVKALQGHTLLRYNDATRGEWKQVLDHWLGRTAEQRGAIFANYNERPLSELHRSHIQASHFFQTSSNSLEKQTPPMPHTPRRGSQQAGSGSRTPVE